MIGHGANPREEKRRLRAQMKARTVALDAGYNAYASAGVCEGLMQLAAYKNARTVFCFVGTEEEIDTCVFLRAALRGGKALCVPLCVSPKAAAGQRGRMLAKRIMDLTQLAVGRFGIEEPPEAAETVPPQQIDLAVLPCMAASADGARLGYGGGYYDRYLPQLSQRCATVLVCRSRLLLPCGTIPEEVHDVRAQLVLTEDGVATVPTPVAPPNPAP